MSSTLHRFFCSLTVARLDEQISKFFGEGIGWVLPPHAIISLMMFTPQLCGSFPNHGDPNIDTKMV